MDNLTPTLPFGTVELVKPKVQCPRRTAFCAREVRRVTNREFDGSRNFLQYFYDIEFSVYWKIRKFPGQMQSRMQLTPLLKVLQTFRGLSGIIHAIIYMSIDTIGRAKNTLFLYFLPQLLQCRALHNDAILPPICNHPVRGINDHSILKSQANLDWDTEDLETFNLCMQLLEGDSSGVSGFPVVNSKEILSA